MNRLSSDALSSSVLKAGIKAGAMAAALSLGIFGLGILTHGIAQAAENPFSQFTGNWSGQGKITVQDRKSVV